MNSTPNRASLAAFGAIALTLIWFYFDIIIVKGAWLVADHAEQHFPWAVYLAQHLKQGKLPFWTDLIHSGFPITAEGQIGSFYLPNLIFYFMLPIKQGYSWNIIFHLFLSAGFMFAYIRSLKIQPLPALFGTLVYLFGSTLGGAYYNITSLKVLAWLPWSLLIIDRALNEGRFRLRQILCLGFIFSLQLLAGYLQYATYSILFSCLYFASRYFEKNRKTILGFFKFSFTFGLTILLAAVIAAPQLILTFNLAMASNRAITNESFAYIGSYPPLALICLLFPSLEGLFVSKLYLGVLPIFFIILSLIAWRQQPVKSLYALTAIALLLALGQFSPLYVGIVKFFKFYAFRTPVKFIFFVGFFLSVLSAFGAQAAAEASKIKGDTTLKKASIAYIAFLILMLGAVISAYLVFHWFEAPLKEAGEKLIKLYIYGKSGHPHSWTFYQEKLNAFIQFAQTVLDPRNPVIVIPTIKMIAAATAVWLFCQKKIKLGPFYLWSFLILSADLHFTYSDIRGDYNSYENYFQKNATTRFLESNLGNYRYFIYSDDPSSSPLPAGKNMLWGLNTANAYSPLVEKKYYDFLAQLGGVNDSTGSIHVNDAYLSANLAKLRALSVKYILTDRSADEILGAPAFVEGKWKTYLLQSPLPIYRFSGDNTQSGIKIKAESEDRIHLSLDSSREQKLIISKLFNTGWTATVNGIRVNPVPAEDIFLSIPVQAGQHEVALQFNPFHDKVHFFKKDTSLVSPQE